MKIYLIGMPGAGKTTLGKALAEELLQPFIDLDREIELQEGKSITELFIQKGEDYFRQIESKILSQWSAAETSFVMATGGGAPCFYKGIDIMNNTGFTILLDEPLTILTERLSHDKKRPLLKSEDDQDLKNKLSNILEMRKQVYQRAKLICTDPTIEKLLSLLKAKM